MKIFDRIWLRLVCLFNGHGEFKTYWRTIAEGVQESEIRCEYCGAHK